MKIFIKYTLSVTLITGIVSATLFALVNTGLRKQRTDYFGKLNELILGDEKFDIIFLGSSRVNWTINPRIIDSATHKNSFNFGLDGAYIVEDGMNLRAYLKTHQKPEVLVINIDPKMFNTTDEIKTPARYLPYINHSEIYDTLKEYSDWPVIVKYMPFVGMSFYTDGIINQSLQAFVQPGRKMENYYKGFSPLKRVWEKNADASAEGLLKVEYTSKGLNLFRLFLEEVKNKKIRIQMIYSPQYYFPRYDSMHKSFMRILDSIAEPEGFSIIDYTTMGICREKKYFFDATHLNVQGATLFSEKLGHDLDSLINHQ
jgi:hypothetical protein